MCQDRKVSSCQTPYSLWPSSAVHWMAFPTAASKTFMAAPCSRDTPCCSTRCAFLRTASWSTPPATKAATGMVYEVKENYMTTILVSPWYQLAQRWIVAGLGTQDRLCTWLHSWLKRCMKRFTDGGGSVEDLILAVYFDRGTASLCEIAVKCRLLRSSWAVRAVYRPAPLV